MQKESKMRSITYIMLLLGLCLLSTCYAAHAQYSDVPDDGDGGAYDFDSPDPEIETSPEETAPAAVPTPPQPQPAAQPKEQPTTPSHPKVEPKVEVKPPMGPIRMVFLHKDITASEKSCPDTTHLMSYHRPDFKGKTLKCNPRGDKNESDGITLEKRKVIENTILPGIEAVIRNGPLMYNLQRPLKIPAEIKKKCSQFYVLQYDFQGVENADVVTYVAAGPMGEEDKDKLVWAMPCASIDGRTVAVGLNLNPSKINETAKVIQAASEEIQKVLGIHECAKEPSVLLNSTTKDGEKSAVCVNMKCEGSTSKKILYKDNAIWTECYGGNAVMSAGNDGENTAKCPPVNDICNDPKFNSDLRQLSPTLKPIRILASLMDLNDSTKYCPDNEESKVARPTFRGVTVNCMKAVNSDFSESLTDEKKKKLTQVIIPKLLSSFEHNPLIVPNEGVLKIPRFDSKSTCTRFNVPNSDHHVGIADKDLVLYIAAGPMQFLERNVSVWAEPCKNINGRTVAIAMNFNPARIMDNATTLEAAKKALSKVLGAWWCPSNNAVLLNSGSADTSVRSTCVSVKCVANNKILVQRRGFGTWHECPEGAFLEPKVHTSMKKVYAPILCPKYETVCSNSPAEVKSVSKIIGEFTALQETEKYVIRSGPQIHNVLTDGAEQIAPMVFAAVIAAVMMVA